MGNDSGHHKNEQLLRIVSEHFRKIRQQKGLSQEAIAMKADLSPKYISKFESSPTSMNPTLSAIGDMIFALDMSLTDFFGHVEKIKMRS
jgi:transcriptional regulator with XRE-family HTH domain